MQSCGTKCPMRCQDERHFKFLLCRFLMKEGVDYTKLENALTAVCRHQFRCPKTGKQENSEEAKKCNLIYHRAE